ncbi:MAG: hypothetical protein JW894_13615 [Bacteroidales bacterium]|nr:hypothetical protein [Bacteroidales bacterium]
MSRIKISSVIIYLLLSGSSVICQAQVKITDGTDVSMNANSLLELESTDKGLLIPRVAIIGLSQTDPLTSPVPVGMLVYSSAGSVPDGFYYWNGTGWTGFSIPEVPITKSTSTTLLKTERLVLASGDITLTLPVVTSADNGLNIIVKNVGTYLDLITVEGNSGATIDGETSTSLTRWFAETFTAWNANWIRRSGKLSSDNRIVISENGSFNSIEEALGFLTEHITKPIIIEITKELNTVTETHVIDLPYPVTFEGTSYGSVTIGPASGMTGKALFNCLSESYFKMIHFDGGTLGGYGSLSGEDAIQLTGSGTYHEIKDCSFDGFYNAVAVMSDAELWLFECDIDNSEGNGLLIDSSDPGTVIKVSETDFTGNVVGINMMTGSNTTVTLNSGFYSNQNPTDIAILYQPATFSFSNLIITGNSWNFVGTSISGFDFSRPDGRDSNAFIENNAGVEDAKPHCKINVVNNALTTDCVVANTWYKANWENTSYITTSFVINDNRITYLPVKPRDVYLIISGNVIVSNINRVITIGIVKNGIATTRYGETALRVTTANQPFQFSTVIYLEDVAENDYFELYCSSANNNDVLNCKDINWYVSAQ